MWARRVRLRPRHVRARPRHPLRGVPPLENPLPIAFAESTPHREFERLLPRWARMFDACSEPRGSKGQSPLGGERSEGGSPGCRAEPCVG